MDADMLEPEHGFDSFLIIQSHAKPVTATHKSGVLNFVAVVRVLFNVPAPPFKSSDSQSVMPKDNNKKCCRLLISPWASSGRG